MAQTPDQELKRLRDPLNGKEGTIFDKEPPTGPPVPPTRSIPKHLMRLVRFFEGIIADESLLLDLCVDRCIGIVEFNYRKRVTGGDLMGEQPTAAHFAQIAAPLSVELYKQVLVSIGDQKEKYTELLTEAQKEMQSDARPSSSILTT